MSLVSGTAPTHLFRMADGTPLGRFGLLDGTVVAVFTVDGTSAAARWCAPPDRLRLTPRWYVGWGWPNQDLTRYAELPQAVQRKLEVTERPPSWPGLLIYRPALSLFGVSPAASSTGACLTGCVDRFRRPWTWLQGWVQVLCRIVCQCSPSFSRGLLRS
jgi:hypothetical protein